MITFDEINALVGQDDARNIDIDEYFDEMYLSEEEKEDRKEFARRLEDELFQCLALLFVFLQFKTSTGIETVKGAIERAILNTINTYTQADSELTLFASNFADSFVDTAVKRSEQYGLFDDSVEKDNNVYRKAGYFFSQVRARVNAADTANGVFNYEEYREEVEQGKSYKQWHTIRDGHERRTHAEVDGTVIPINRMFRVGNALMRFPHDISVMEEHPEELINCRCQAEYLTDEQFQNILRDL